MKQSTTSRNIAYWIVGLQSLVVVIVAGMFWLFGGIVSAYSVMLGGIAAIIPSFIFAFQLFADTRARMAKVILLRFFLGETLKLMLSVGLFLVIIRYLPINLIACLIGFIVAQFGFWLTPLTLKMENNA